MKNYSKPLSKEMLVAISKHYKNVRFDYVSCVPLHKSKLKSRGYNQAELLAKFLATELNATFVPILIKTKNTPAQHELSFDEREENIKGAYRTNKSIQIDKNKKLLPDLLLSKP